MQDVDFPPKIPSPAILAGSRALASGHPLAALSAVGLDQDPHAQALRGIALAQLGEFERSKRDLVQALAAFQRDGEVVWTTKALAALAEVGFATRDLDIALRGLDAAPLRRVGDDTSAAYVEIQRIRLLALLGRTTDAKAALAAVGDGPAAALAKAEVAASCGRFGDAVKELEAVGSDNPLLAGEARRFAAELARPAFYFQLGTNVRRVSLLEVENLRAPYVDTVRRRLGALDLRLRPAELELAIGLARGPVTAATLFGRANESLAVRLRMEVSRLRRSSGLEIVATDSGFVCAPLGLLLPEVPGLEAVLADGEAWPPRAIAAVLGETLRTTQRRLAEATDVVKKGAGRSIRYQLAAGRVGIATRLLLLTREPLS